MIADSITDFVPCPDIAPPLKKTIIAPPLTNSQIKKKATKKVTGYVIYEGPSLLDGSPIVVIMTGLGGSKNRKTGEVAQTWIMRSDMTPIEAFKIGADSTVCGNCPYRWSLYVKNSGAPRCYVNLGQAPLSIYKAYKRGSYPALPLDYTLPPGMGLRLGSYGDPVAVPMKAWKSLIDSASFHLAYTHQWKEFPVQSAPYKGLCMASVGNALEALQAVKLGWKFFRVESAPAPIGLELNCPSDKATHGEHIRQCEACKLCNGSKASIWITPH